MKKRSETTSLKNSIISQIRGNKTFFIDIESTGFDPIRNDIITGTIIVADEDLSILSQLSFKSRPDFNKFYSDEAEKVHGISKSKMKSFPRRMDTCIEILNFLKPHLSRNRYPLVFHANGNFDWKMLHGMFYKEDIQYSLYKIFDESLLISTLEMGKDYKRSLKQPLNKNNNLKYWADYIGFDLVHHTAESDTHCCYNLYKYFHQRLQSKYELGKDN